jgi:hypothetical protein
MLIEMSIIIFATMLDEVHRGSVDRLACDGESHKGLDYQKRHPESLMKSFFKMKMLPSILHASYNIRENCVVLRRPSGRETLVYTTTKIAYCAWHRKRQTGLNQKS